VISAETSALVAGGMRAPAAAAAPAVTLRPPPPPPPPPASAGRAPGGGPRLSRATGVGKIRRTRLNGEHLDQQGECYQLKREPPRISTISGKCPAFYFGGLSDEARECAAEGCDVYLMWPDVMGNVRSIIADMKERAARHGRTLRFSYRAHVIVRETEE